MSRARLRTPRPPEDSDFSSWLRSPAVASRVGLWLGVCFGVAFLTGLLSHAAQEPGGWWPTRPVWGYRFTQGLHVVAGTAAVPLLLVKLWTVFPRLFARPPLGRLKPLLLHAFERASIGVLVATAVFQLATGLANAAQWYPWSFSFRATHYAVAWVAVGALLVHVAVKLPVIRQTLEEPLDGGELDRPGTVRPAPADVAGPSRRGLLRATWTAVGVAVVLTAGATVPWLRSVSVLATRSGEGPAGIPVNRSARAADVVASATSASYRLTIASAEREVALSLAELAAFPQRTAELPIACVEGWSASGKWTGVRLRDLADLVAAPRGSAVRVVSLQESGPFRESLLPGSFVDDDLTLLALRLEGEPLSLDHGFPCRIIAPNRPGVLQTKWVGRLEVAT